jgi:hypothetical protein
MTEVVTNSAALLQPLLQAHKPQVFGVFNADSPQVELQIAAAASRDQAAVAATEAPRTSDDRASLNADSGSNGGAQNLPPRAQARAPAVHDLAAPTGPSKARVEIPPPQLTVEAPAPKPAASSLAPAPVAAAPARQAPPVQAAADAPAPAPKPVDADPLGPAEQLNALALESVAQNIVGVAFAPVQLSAQTAADDPAAAQRQKNFIFSQRKLFAETEAGAKFAAEEAKRAVHEALQDTTPRFAVEAAAQTVTATVASGKFASEGSQKLFDKAPADPRGAGVEAGGEVRLYDKVPQAETGNKFAPEQDSRGQGDNAGGRESLYQRAAAIANALGEKSANPEVKKLFNDIERYAAQTPGGAGTTAAAVVSPSVIVTA